MGYLDSRMDRWQKFWAKYDKCPECKALPKNPCTDKMPGSMQKRVLNSAHLIRGLLDG